jgi:hypothetical protein
VRRPSHLGPRAAAVLAATVLVFTNASAVSAQETTTTVAGPEPLATGVSLVSQSTWVGLRETFTMKLHLDNRTLAAKPGAAIAITVYQSTTSRSGFDNVIQNSDLGGTFYVPNKIPVSSLSPDANDNVTIVFGLAGSDARQTIGITRPGVYPVKVELVNTGAASGSFVTWLVAVDTRSEKPIDKPLGVAFVFQAIADPMTLPDGSDDPKVVAQLKPGGRLDKIANLLAQTKGLRFSLAMGPETAESWKRLGKRDRKMASSFKALSVVANRSTTEVLPSTYVPIDAAIIDEAGLGSHLGEQYDAGTSALRAAFGSNLTASAQSSFIDPAPTADAVVNGLRAMLFDRVAVRDQALIQVTHRFSPAQAFVLDTTGGESRAVATAPFIEDLFSGHDPSALRAQRVIAALAEVAYESPGIARGVVIAPPARWNPDLKTMTTVVDAVRTLPLVQSATLDDLLGTISSEQVLGANDQATGANVQRRLVPATPTATPVDPAEYEATATKLAAYRAVVGDADPVVVRGEAGLLTALSTTITPERAHAELAQIDKAVGSFSNGIRADEKRITLTSRRAGVPLTFENTLQPARSVKVRIHLESAKLLFPDGADQIKTLEPGNNTIRFTVEARASGTFPMTISVTSPDGRLPFGAPVRVTVRSAVFGGWAVGLTIAALVFLAGWWANHFRRTRRNRRLASESATPPTPAPAT